MHRSVAGLLCLAVLLVAANAGQSSTTALAPQLAPNLPPGDFVARVYYSQISDLAALAGYDIWEYNNLEEKFVLVALSEADYLLLEQEGWQLEVDWKATTDIKNHSLRPFLNGYKTVDEIYATLESLNAQFPTLSEWVTYGDGYCLTQGGCSILGGEFFAGYPLQALRISNEDVSGTSIVQGLEIVRGQKPVFVLLANIHAREITTAEIAMRFAEWMLTQYGQDADATWLVDWHELWIIPTANPEGHWLVELGSSPPYDGAPFYQRKNLNNDVDDDQQSDCSVWPPSAGWQYGVDLNRNHSFAWGPPGSSSEPCSQTFRGPHMASEPETAALQQLVRKLIPDQRGPALEDSAPLDTTGILLTLHSYSELILRPWGHTSQEAPNEPGLKAIGDKMATYSGYRSCQPGSCLYGANGATDDWAYGELGIPAFTFEIGREFMPPYEMIDAVQWPENKPAFIYAAKIARSPYQTVWGPDVTQAAVSSHVASDAIQISVVIDETDHGGQNIQDAVYSVDTPFWSDGALPLPTAAADGAYDSVTEDVVITIDPGSLSAGKHIVFIRGQDSAGNFGVTASVFIEVEATRLFHFPLVLRNK
ncbi:MAG: M14 family zinc carboxypeptidase [Candidatus Promineifilaceae bacterium]|nr:M14 family zinc carboxypeptidase [Candidatus Promineifilaceae bacterium]